MINKKTMIILVSFLLVQPVFGQFNFYFSMLSANKIKYGLKVVCVNGTGETIEVDAIESVSLEENYQCQVETNSADKSLTTLSKDISWEDTATGNSAMTIGSINNGKIPLNIGICGYNTGLIQGQFNWTDSAGDSYSTNLNINCPKNIWGSGADGNFTATATTTNLCTENTSTETCVKQYKNFTVNSGVTVSTDRAKKGLVIYVNGDAVINGIISMTNKGVAGDVGGDIVLSRISSNGLNNVGQSSVNLSGSTVWNNVENKQKSLNSNNVGFIYTLKRNGADGAVETNSGGKSKKNGEKGNNGDNGRDLSSGGGGAGGAFGGNSSNVGYGGAGGSGSPFSGGSGGGGGLEVPNSTKATGGSPFGAQGGKAGVHNSWSDIAGGGGAGNPGGLKSRNCLDGSAGTGGTIILIVKGNLTINGQIQSKGAAGGNCTGSGYGKSGGGGSGGGIVLVLHGGNPSGGLTISTTGGLGGTASGSTQNALGGAGGAGSFFIEKIDK